MKNTKALIKALQTIGLDPTAAITDAFDNIQTGERTSQDAAIVKAVLDDALDLAAAAKSVTKANSNEILLVRS